MTAGDEAPGGAGEARLSVALPAAIARQDVPTLCRMLARAIEAARAREVVCDAAALVVPDMVTVDAVARLQLTALRLGARVQLRNASPELLDLIRLAGLAGPFRVSVRTRSGASVGPGELRVEPRGQPEERKQPLGVEEERDPLDPPA